MPSTYHKFILFGLRSASRDFLYASCKSDVVTRPVRKASSCNASNFRTKSSPRVSRVRFAVGLTLRNDDRFQN